MTATRALLERHLRVAHHRNVDPGRGMTLGELLDEHARDHELRAATLGHVRQTCDRCHVGEMIPVRYTATAAASVCLGCGAAAHAAVCVDDRGRVECVCGLDDLGSSQVVVPFPS